MEIKYFIEPIFKVEFFKIKSINFENKREQIEKLFEQYPEIRLQNFYTNRNKSNMTWELQEVFKDEFNLIRTKFNSKIDLKRTWSVSYDKGDYHVAHNHGSLGYAGIIYLRLKKGSPGTTYIQPWNNEKDQSVLYAPEVEEGDIMIVPQFLTHFTNPNKLNFKKRIISFDFTLND
tara:strand:- start:10 stop:534 length:525 start_codon:yes stop_codon:yes gene_type:complete